jgi:replicative DNA helicase
MNTAVRQSSKQQAASEILDRLPPHNADAEASVIGSLLLAHDYYDEVSDIVKPGDFYGDAPRLIYEAIAGIEAVGGHSDETTVVEALKRSGNWERIGGAAALLGMAHSVAVASHARQYAEIVAEQARLRRIIHASFDAVRDCYGLCDSETIAVKLERELTAAIGSTASDSIVTASEAARRACERFDALRSRPDTASVLTGLYEIDNGPGGLFPGELTVLAARPGMGKTSLALQIALHCGHRNRLTYFATMEMDATQLAARTVCGMAGVEGRKARTGDLSDLDMRSIVEACNEFARARLWIDERPRMTTADIRRGAKRAAQFGLSLVCVDYLGLIRPADARLPREQQVAGAAWDLKQLAMELRVPVLLLSQLNRQTDEHEQPDLRHLRESGAIEQHADAVWFLWCHEPTTDEFYNACFGVAKNRNGEKGVFGLHWRPEKTRFESLSEPTTANHADEFDAYSGV